MLQSSRGAKSAPRKDHDRLFKALLTVFFVEFLDLFFPDLAAAIDRGSVEFLDKQHFTNLFAGKKYDAGIVVKVRFKESGAYFLIHIEHQHSAPTAFPRRFFRYFSMIFEKNGLPIYPIVIFGHDKPKKQQPDFYAMSIVGAVVLLFNYKVVQLNRMSWKTFLKSDNPVAAALMAKMDIDEQDRPKVKAQCLRMLLRLRVDDARKDLIGAFVDTYLPLNEAEQEQCDAEIPPKEKKRVMEMMTSWGIKGREQGLQEGREEGREQGRYQEARRISLELLEEKFGKLPKRAIRAIENIESIDGLRARLKKSWSAASLRELGL